MLLVLETHLITRVIDVYYSPAKDRARRSRLVHPNAASSHPQKEKEVLKTANVPTQTDRAPCGCTIFEGTLSGAGLKENQKDTTHFGRVP